MARVAQVVRLDTAPDAGSVSDGLTLHFEAEKLVFVQLRHVDVAARHAVVNFVEFVRPRQISPRIPTQSESALPTQIEQEL